MYEIDFNLPTCDDDDAVIGNTVTVLTDMLSNGFGHNDFDYDKPETVLADSGKRTSYEGGGVRETDCGKGRCDLLPLDIVDELIYHETPWHYTSIPNLINHYIWVLDEEHEDYTILLEAFKGFAIKELGWGLSTALIEVSKQFEEGAKKYSPNNWRKGLPVHCYLDSAVRHYLKWVRGDKDEPHDRACLWNLICAAWTIKHKPEFIDV